MSNPVIKYQQGDVLLTKIDKAPPSRCSKIYTMAESNGYKVTLAFGEATGHHHRFERSETAGSKVMGYSHRWQDLPIYVEVQGSNATLKHEEHNPINVEPGIYQVSQVNEFDHIGGVTRTVID